MTDGAAPTPAELPREPLVFARTLQTGTLLSVIVLVSTFASYMGGVVEAWVPIADLPRLWGLDAGRYLAAARLPGGWGWLRLVGYGDILNFVGISMLTAVTIVCYLAILPGLVRRRDVAYTLIVLAEVAILGLAASGLVAAGH